MPVTTEQQGLPNGRARHLAEVWLNKLGGMQYLWKGHFLIGGLSADKIGTFTSLCIYLVHHPDAFAYSAFIKCCALQAGSK